MKTNMITKKILIVLVMLLTCIMQTLAFSDKEVDGVLYSSNIILRNSDYNYGIAGSVVGIRSDLKNVVIKDRVSEYPILGIDMREPTENKVMTSISFPRSIFFFQVYIGNKPFSDSLQQIHIQDLENWCKIDFNEIRVRNYPPDGIMGGEWGERYFYPDLSDFRNSCPLYKPDAELYLNGELVKDLIIPNGINRLPKFVFYGNKFNSITLPASLTSIEGLALTPFQGWTINEVHAPDINKWCSIKFNYWESIVDESSNGPYGHPDMHYYYYSNFMQKGTKLYLDGKFIEGQLSFPDDLTEIGGHAFQNYSYITSVSIGPNIKTIGKSAFADCENLSTIRYEEGVKEIEGLSMAAASAESGKYTASIDGELYFQTLYLPSTLTSMSSQPGFWRADNLKAVVISATEPPVIGESTFCSRTYQEGTLYVPEGTAELYRNAKYWKNFKHITEEKFDDVKVVEDSMSEGIDYSRPYEIYSVSGMRIGCSYDELPAGIYIIRQNGKSRKIVRN